MGAPTRGAQPCQQGSTVFKPASRVKTRMGWIRLVCVAGLFSLAAQPSPSPANPQLQIRHHARSLGPGEVVRFSLSLPQPAKQVRLKAWDKTFACFRVSPQHWEGLLGIDLAIPAGDYPVDVEVDGVLQPRQLMLKVASKTFPTRHLTVDPKFVTPPADDAGTHSPRVAPGCLNFQVGDPQATLEPSFRSAGAGGADQRIRKAKRTQPTTAQPS